MRKSDVEIGQTYVVKVSGRLARVRVVSVCPYGGWMGINESTHREVRIRSAARLRYQSILGRSVRAADQPAAVVGS